MNGEMHQICMLVSQARNAMAGKNEFEYMAEGYINSILFSFTTQKKFFGEESRKTYSPREWYAECIHQHPEGRQRYEISCAVAGDGQVVAWIFQCKQAMYGFFL